MVERVQMSTQGYQKLRNELQRLEKFERIDVVKAIEVARAHGDLKENAEYHAAKERQGHIEGRIMELKDKLGRAEVINCMDVPTQRAVFGTVVTLLDLETDAQVSYQLLGTEEADVKKGSISVFSPLGRSILGKEVGDEVTAKTPGGTREFEVIEITSSSFA
ncbi:MAG: transcription elongation factor GreA [Proteobacteria bacterium]|nr:transcription elongation factor GreA [Pseudomonadota bacterium]